MKENKQWYYVLAQLGHQGTGRSLAVSLYVWANNPIEVMKKYKKMGGIKKNKTPNIKVLSNEESQKLEEIISQDGLALESAKRKWYTDSEHYKWW